MSNDNTSPETSQPYLIPIQSDHYNAAVNGEFEAFEKMEETQLLNLLTPNKNTVLHIHITACTDEKTDFVEAVLKACPALHLQSNAKGETPLHMAARFGHFSVVTLLIFHAKARGDVVELKNMLSVANQRNDTALHEAVRFHHPKVVGAFLHLDPNLANSVNIAGESPLYIAAERGFSGIARGILDICSSPATNGPNGRTALHASTTANDEVSTENILSKFVELTRIADGYNWIPLHYAAKLGHLNIAKLLLKFDKDSVYVKDKEGKTALHIAALNGKHEVMKEIMSVSPGCSELIDDRGCNVLHFAVECDETEAVKLILKDSSLSNLLHEKNLDGNTPLHHCATLESDEALTLLVSHPREDGMAFNDHNKNAHDIVSTSKGHFLAKFSMLADLETSFINRGHRIMIREKEKDASLGQNEDDKKDPLLNEFQKFMEYGIIVPALIATVTFTAGFTVPGGYFSNEGSSQGTAILGKKTAFKAFIISNTLAMVLSTLSILLHIAVIATRAQSVNKLFNTVIASLLTLFSLVAMVVAFVSGTYAILSPYRSLAIAACVIGTSFFLLYVIVEYVSSGPSKLKAYYRQNTETEAV